MGKRIVQVAFGFQIFYLLLSLVALVISRGGNQWEFWATIIDDVPFSQLLSLPIIVMMVITVAITIGFFILLLEIHQKTNIILFCLFLLYAVWIACSFIFNCGIHFLYSIYVLIAIVFFTDVCLSIRFFHCEKGMMIAMIVTSALPVLILLYSCCFLRTTIYMEWFPLGMPGIGNCFPACSSDEMSNLLSRYALLLPQIMSAVLRLVSVSTNTSNVVSESR